MMGDASITLSASELASIIADAVARGVSAASSNYAESKRSARNRRYYESKRLKTSENVLIESESDKASPPTLSLSPLSPTPPIPTLPHTPPHVREASEDAETDSKPKAWNPTPQQSEVALWFKRKPTTRWSEKEIKAWRKLQPIDEEDFDVVRWLHTTSGCDYKRRKLSTLLNNWNDEVDIGRNYDPDKSRK